MMNTWLCMFVISTASVVYVLADTEITVKETTTSLNTSKVNATVDVKTTTITTKAAIKPTTLAPKAKVPLQRKTLRHLCNMFCRRKYNRTFLLPDCKYIKKNKWVCFMCRRIRRCSTVLNPL
ncbi:unnamed protein product [Clavelina lepadiformis]|uniref:Uncharacterized protein n=1 Tax=Clavelina lepadiformis TaxID=159417 RepID=A0ABP0GRB2_CLALP